MVTQVNVIIIGAGTAGLSALREVRRKTDDFLLVNAGDWGTTCAARGCMPSKALIEAANAFHQRHTFTRFGLTGGAQVGIDLPAVLARVRRLRDGFVKGPEAVPRELGDRAITGRARLLGPGRVVVDEREFSARRIILATGSRPVVPQPWTQFGARILTTDTLFEQCDLPRRIAVVGMGPIGIEMAQALSRLGLEVAGFDSVETLAGLSDPQVMSTLHQALMQEFPLYLGAPAELAAGAAGEQIRVHSTAGEFTADAVLVAVGRRPNIDELGLETLGVPLDDTGMPSIDPTTLQVGSLPVWLAGDANNQRALLHEAADEGHIAGRNAVADTPETYCRRTPLSIVFAAPGVAQVGARWADLEADTTAIGCADFSRQGRARTQQRAGGLMRIYADINTGQLRGAELCVPDAEHMAHLLALAMQQDLTVQDMLAMPFYHPVLEEGLRSALRDLARQVPGAGGSDLSACPALGIAALD